MENIRARNNRAIIKHMVQNGGKTIKHEDFNDKLPSLCEDYSFVICLLLEKILFCIHLKRFCLILRQELPL